MSEKPVPSVLELEGYSHKGGSNEKICEWPNCAEKGLHRAPRSRANINSYHWFCREHVRSYNKNWNYFDGMSDYEVEADRRADTVWQRPSWPLGECFPSTSCMHTYLREQDSFVFFDPIDDSSSGWQSSGIGELALGNDLKNALTIFGLELPVSMEDVKTRYKILVKRHHPDSSKQNTDEERIKDINQAYQKILTFLSP